MDKRGCGLVRRCDFYEASTAHVTLEMRRTITRGDLHQRFRFDASEMTIQELVGLVWPNASGSDRKQMDHWAKLRDASAVLLDTSFKATREDLKRIFDLLDVDGSETLSISELVRARILTKSESKNLLESWYYAFNRVDECSSESGSEHSPKTMGTESGKKPSLSLSFDEFCRMTQQHLAEKYVQKDEGNRWDVHARSAFRVSKVATAMLQTDRDNFESSLKKPLSPEKPQKVPLKSVAVGIKTALSAFASKDLDENAAGRVVMAN